MTEQELFRLLLALTILLASSLMVGNMLNSIKLPRVIGEIFAGLLLGPSLLGYVFPDIYVWIFAYSDHQQIMLSVFYWMGLILLMFSAGFSIQLDFPKKDQLLIVFIVLGGTVFPLIAGFIFSRIVDNSMSADPLAFSLV